MIPTCASWTTYTDSRVVCVWASCVCAESLVEKCGQLTADAKRAQNVARTHEVRAADARKEAEKYRRELDTVTVRTLSQSSHFAYHLFIFIYLYIYMEKLINKHKNRKRTRGRSWSSTSSARTRSATATFSYEPAELRLSFFLSLFRGDVVGLGSRSDTSNAHQETYDRDIQDKDYDKAKDGTALLSTTILDDFVPDVVGVGARRQSGSPLSRTSCSDRRNSWASCRASSTAARP